MDSIDAKCCHALLVFDKWRCVMILALRLSQEAIEEQTIIIRVIPTKEVAFSKGAHVNTTTSHYLPTSTSSSTSYAILCRQLDGALGFMSLPRAVSGAIVLEEQIGNVKTGLTKEKSSKSMKQKIYVTDDGQPLNLAVYVSVMEISGPKSLHTNLSETNLENDIYSYARLQGEYAKCLRLLVKDLVLPRKDCAQFAKNQPKNQTISTQDRKSEEKARSGSSFI
uniref:Uncharacterized protein n=1 Tax=Tanacetum cinerariifolium TaxID=118510 RepID=A0A699HBY6_TANCI|nr:hypothetical protein [Tanacetum cinerariifolium]